MCKYNRAFRLPIHYLYSNCIDLIAYIINISGHTSHSTKKENMNKISIQPEKSTQE